MKKRWQRFKSTVFTYLCGVELTAIVAEKNQARGKTS
jgi:hypothetical protein